MREAKVYLRHQGAQKIAECDKDMIAINKAMIMNFIQN